jgi:hypothetical protein
MAHTTASTGTNAGTRRPAVFWCILALDIPTLGPRIVRLPACDWPPAPRPAPSEITCKSRYLLAGGRTGVRCGWCARIRLLPGTEDAKAGIGGTVINRIPVGKSPGILVSVVQLGFGPRHDPQKACYGRALCLCLRLFLRLCRCLYLYLDRPSMLVRLYLAVAANLSGPVRSAWPERLHLLPLPSLLCLPAVCFLSLSCFLHRGQRVCAHPGFIFLLLTNMTFAFLSVDRC